MNSAMLRTLGIRLVVTAVLSWHPVGAHAEETKVTIDNFTFTPAELTGKARPTVTWNNPDDIPHVVVSAGKFRSKTLDTDESYSFTFTTAGEYKYFCSLHPHMTGTIKV